jgi:hypothetical protein
MAFFCALPGRTQRRRVGIFAAVGEVVRIDVGREEPTLALLEQKMARCPALRAAHLRRSAGGRFGVAATMDLADDGRVTTLLSHLVCLLRRHAPAGRVSAISFILLTKPVVGGGDGGGDRIWLRQAMTTRVPRGLGGLHLATSSASR